MKVVNLFSLDTLKDPKNNDKSLSSNKLQNVIIRNLS